MCLPRWITRDKKKHYNKYAYTLTQTQTHTQIHLELHKKKSNFERKAQRSKQTNCVFRADFILFLNLCFRFDDGVHQNSIWHIKCIIYTTIPRLTAIVNVEKKIVFERRFHDAPTKSFPIQMRDT